MNTIAIDLNIEDVKGDFIVNGSIADFPLCDVTCPECGHVQKAKAYLRNGLHVGVHGGECEKCKTGLECHVKQYKVQLIVDPNDIDVDTWSLIV